MKKNRRSFFRDTALSTAGLIFSRRAMGQEASKRQNIASRDIMQEVRSYRKIDSHAHVYFRSDSPEIQISLADRLSIEKMVISRPMKPGGVGSPDEFIACNDLVLSCVNRYPDRFIGQMTLNPQFPKACMEEIDRCIDAGMVGLKLYNHVKISDPLFYPIIEKFIDLKMVILMHVGIGKSRITYDPREPENVSIPIDFVEAAARYPEAMFQFAHLAGGEDWEDACKALKNSPNVYVDISGSNNDAAIVDFALSYLGEDRLLFGCDNSFYQGVGHVLAAKLTDDQRQKIYFDNYNKILRKSGNHVD